MQEEKTNKKIAEKKKILVYGAGSLGCYLAAKLYSVGHKVDVIGRSKADAIKGKLYINDELYNFPAVKKEINSEEHYNYIFLTSKYYDLKKNLETLVNSGVRFDTLVLIQNTYIDNLWYYHLIKDKPIVTISVVEGFNLDANKLHFRSAAGWFVEDDILGKDIYLLLKNTGININLTDDINKRRAEKSVFNCSLNIFSAYYQKTISDLFKDREIFKEMQNVFSETYDILSEILPMRSEKALWKAFLESYKKMDHYASTYQDVIRNKKTEISFLNGFIVELGRKMDMPTPRNIDIVHKFKAKYPDLY